MSKSCPIVGGNKVPYLTCLECDDRVCEKPRVTLLPKKKKEEKQVLEENKSVPKQTEEPARGECASCETCFHKMNQQMEKLFGKEMLITYCEVWRNHLIDSVKVSHEGCEYHNRDLSKEEICLNCEHYLGGGDWGLACAAEYHRLPTALSKACEKFEKKLKK
jgi:hypothetical protein